MVFVSVFLRSKGLNEPAWRPMSPVASSPFHIRLWAELPTMLRYSGAVRSCRQQSHGPSSTQFSPQLRLRSATWRKALRRGPGQCACRVEAPPGHRGQPEVPSPRSPVSPSTSWPLRPTRRPRRHRPGKLASNGRGSSPPSRWDFAQRVPPPQAAGPPNAPLTIAASVDVTSRWPQRAMLPLCPSSPPRALRPPSRTTPARRVGHGRQCHCAWRKRVDVRTWPGRSTRGHRRARTLTMEWKSGQ